MTRWRTIRAGLAVLLLTTGIARFVQAGLGPAIMAFNRAHHTMLVGDFGASFPTSYFARLRPDFPTEQVWFANGWNYGPMVHFLTLPLFLAPAWWMVPGLWALANMGALVVSFVLLYRMSGMSGRVSWTAIATLVALWCWFKPLHSCLEAGDVEIMEMVLILAAVNGLRHARSGSAGVLIGMATMLKFLPIQFLLWLGVRRQWRAVITGGLSIAAIAAITAVTLGWQNHAAFQPMDKRGGGVYVVSVDASNPLAARWGKGLQAGPDAQAVTSLFVNFAGLVDFDNRVPYLGQRWFPASRLNAAVAAAAVASILLAVGFGLVLLRSRDRPVSPFEVSGLFMAMFLLVPYNHQYYYVFALVPLSVLFLTSMRNRQWGVLTLTIVGYLLMSPPFRFTWVDRTSWFNMPFFYVHSYSGAMVIGALIIWATATYQLLSARSEPLS